MIYRTSVGLDVHARSIAAAAFVPETGEVVTRSFGYDPSAVAEWVLSLPQPSRCVYESGPTGFDLQRRLEKAGVGCVVGAVSKMLRPSGDRVKTDRRDAIFLARMLAVGNVVEVAVPTEAMEAARDLARAREDCRHDLTRARHLLSKFLLRKGIVYDGGGAWTKAHARWLSGLEFADPTEQLVFDEYLEGVRSLELRRDRLDRAIAERASEPDLAPTVAAIRCLRGASTVTAFSVAAEVGDFSRFPTARSFMSYVGLVPSESSSGETVSRGGITRAGNAHVRTLLVEAAWQHARPLRALSPTAASAYAAVPAGVSEAAARANRRLHDGCAHLRGRGKPACVVNTAIARELAGFVWALARMAA
ncbi:MAG: IS110 family transposase [Olsenella sp.]|nr:IS110 family transposase [Olsenella sp.]